MNIFLENTAILNVNKVENILLLLLFQNIYSRVYSLHKKEYSKTKI